MLVMIKNYETIYLFLKEEVLLNFQICNESQIFNAFFSENFIEGKII